MKRNPGAQIFRFLLKNRDISYTAREVFSELPSLGNFLNCYMALNCLVKTDRITRKGQRGRFHFSFPKNKSIEDIRENLPVYSRYGLLALIRGIFTNNSLLWETPQGIHAAIGDKFSILSVRSAIHAMFKRGELTRRPLTIKEGAKRLKYHYTTALIKGKNYE